jgi:hypothetical protein
MMAASSRDRDTGDILSALAKSEADALIVTCWCGAEGHPDELFDDGLGSRCGGLGTLNCYCGGDVCVCHYHGEAECPGCPDCEDREGDDDYD